MDVAVFPATITWSDVNCPACHNRRLLGLEAITSLDNTSAGPIVRYRCSCGTRAEMMLGGRPERVHV